ncbi:Tectonic-3, partial [Stegodyphus mimosarum]
MEKILHQHFAVDFKWTNLTEVFRKSGNPGYQVGFPILAGTNSTTIDSEQQFYITIHPDGLSVLDKNSAGNCESERRSIKFGMNLKLGCHFKIPSSQCKIVQEAILAVLLGPSKKQIFVGMFGNANSSSNDDWIEVYHEELDVATDDDKCYLITDLQIDVLYAAVGTIANPQYKILGVGYHYIRPEIVDLSCSTQCPDLTLSTSVSFFDITQPAVPIYPKLPTIKANLPDDFFYPFVY